MKMPESVVLLAPTDMSDASLHGVVYAVDLARRLGALLILYYVIPSEELEEGLEEGRFVDRQSEEVGEQLVAWFNRAIPAADRDGVHAQVAVGFGRADEEILRKAEIVHPIMIVMATHGRTGLQRAVFGSVTEAVLHHSSLPVLIIRAGPRRESGRI
jgi:nucleotide-binding universal stress UspA family protein